MRLRKFGFPGGGLALLTLAVILPVLLLACGGDDAPPPTPVISAQAGTTAAPIPTEAASEPEPTSLPTVAAPMATPELTTEPAPSATPVQPAPTSMPTVAAPTATPEPTRPAAATPAPTPVIPAQAGTAVEPCEGTRGGEVGNCAPEFEGTQAWINSDPLTMQGLRGKVVLIDFWTYSCINCIRTLPFLQTWHERYADEGLVIVGVHTPEFLFEQVLDNVVDATVDMGVAWPVVQDNDFVVWGSYDNRFWPAKYLIDQHGEIRYRHFGEGKYAETEEQIRALLAETGAGDDALAMPLPEDQRPDSAYLGSDARQTPELFAGWTFVNSHFQAGRGLYVGQLETYMEAAQASYRAGDQQGAVAEFVQPARLLPDMIYFHGPWSIGPESAVHARETQAYTDAVILLYSARSVNAVLTSGSGEPYKVLITVNNQYLTEENRGEDVIIGENGESYVMVSDPRAYRLVEHAAFEEGQILAISSLSDDFGLFSFTFGSYEDGF